ncbi:hypothetical protein H4R19_001485 [Coemansia spiralis]|nr:hypothetical protein H4R19_001485 [Coemansia spiralis]
MRLKEAANINKSLSTLGNVINSLVDIGNGRSRHVNYRDSKLTFLLRDSLGGNSVTFIIANVSPAMCNDAETASTLRFAQRAKMIRNKAVVNQDMQGNVPQLQAEIQRLKAQIAQLKIAQPGATANGGALSPTSTLRASTSGDPRVLGGMAAGADAAEPGCKEHQTTQFLLILAMRKLRETERQKARYSEIILELRSALNRQRLQHQQHNMVLKLKNAEIAALRRNAPIGYVTSSENAALREEITALQSALSAQPDYSDLFIENIQLREDLEYYYENNTRAQDPELPRRSDAAAALETLISAKACSVDLQGAFPIIPDDNVYLGLEDKIKQAKHDINDLELQRDRLEFQINSIEEDWQFVNDGAHKLEAATSDEEIAETVEKTLDCIVGDQARDTWRTISALYARSY